MRCEELREGTRVVVSELKAVAAEHPELATLLASYGVKLPGVRRRRIERRIEAY